MTDGWEVPVPLASHGDLPAFPVEGFPEWIRAFVLAEAEATQTPIDMAGMFVLAALATACGGHVQVEPLRGWVEGVNLFIVVEMEPGSRKSSVHRDTMSPLVAYERLLVEQAQPNLAEQASIRRIAEQVLAKAEKAAAAAKDDAERLELHDEARTAAAALERLKLPAAPRLFTDDVTPEKLATMLYDNEGRMAVLSAEGGVFDILAGRYNSGRPNIDVYLKGHAGDVLRVDRQNRSREYVDRPALTVGLAVQRHVLAKAARVSDFAGRGLLDRFLYSIPVGTVGFRRTDPLPVSDEIRRMYDTSLRALVASFDRLEEPITLRLSDEANARFATWRKDIEPRRRPDSDLGHIQGWSSKLDGAVARIAALIHMAKTFDGPRTTLISDATMAAALEIGDYLIAHALAAYDLMGEDPSLEGARYVLAWIGNQGRTSFTKRECHIAHRARFPKAADVDPVLASLVEAGYIREVTHERVPGRPSRRFLVNPNL